MIAEGQIVLFRFPQTDLNSGKLRPALVVRRLPGRHEDWLICMISSQLSQECPGFDEILTPDSPNFGETGLKLPSLIRLGRLAVVNADVLVGGIGKLDDACMLNLRRKLAEWIHPA